MFLCVCVHFSERLSVREGTEQCKEKCPMRKSTKLGAARDDILLLSSVGTGLKTKPPYCFGCNLAPVV